MRTLRPSALPAAASILGRGASRLKVIPVQPMGSTSVSHEPTRQREYQMHRFKSPGQAQRFLAVNAVVGNLFRLGRHLTRATHYRMFRARAFAQWQELTYAR
jgi:transposase-like protein